MEYRDRKTALNDFEDARVAQLCEQMRTDELLQVRQEHAAELHALYQRKYGFGHEVRWYPWGFAEDTSDAYLEISMHVQQHAHVHDTCEIQLRYALDDDTTSKPFTMFSLHRYRGGQFGILTPELIAQGERFHVDVTRLDPYLWSEFETVRDFFVNHASKLD